MKLSFGPYWQEHLWASPFCIRFELNKGGSKVRMFTSSYDRARTLLRAALPDNEVVAIVASNPHATRRSVRRHGWASGAPFDHLAEMGVQTEPALAAWTGAWWESDEADKAKPWHQRAVRLNWDEVDILLWNQIAHDLGVRPQADVLSKFVDLDRGISVNAYDDRGMDVTALNAEAITDLYMRFDEWLLDHDRPRMLEAFQR